MPGVADQIRRTKLTQEHRARKKDMDELLAMVREGRLSEADERQLETLKLALQLQTELEGRRQPLDTSSGKDEIVEAVKAALSEIVTNLPAGVGTKSSPVEDPSRPGMKHTSLADFIHTDEKVSISHGDELTESKEGTEDAGGKLEKLRKIKGNN